MQKISSCVRELRFSVIREMSMRAAQYDDAITLGIGEPDMHTPQHICQAAYQDACAGHTHYAPSKGDPELLQALATSLQTRNNPGGVENLLITHGAMHGLAAAMRTLLEVGDEVLLPAPHFPDYVPHVRLAGGRPIDVPLDFDSGFVPRAKDIEPHITERTRILVLNSPNNPTGAVIPGDALDELAELAKARDLVVISDEVYDRILFDGEYQSIITRPGMAERTLVMNSFSKAYAMTGWRVGYVLGPTWIVEQMLKVVNYTLASVNTLGQRAALAALQGDVAPFQDMATEFAHRSAYVYERLIEMPGIRVHKPGGSFYLFPSVAALEADGERFANQLLEEEHVVVIPGFSFGAGAESCVRLACTVDMQRLEEAMDRLERFVHRLHGKQRGMLPEDG